jgi:hypothetical protein
MRLTTQHSSSSYGQPVLLAANGTVYGPSDLTPNGQSGAEYVRTHTRCGRKALREQYCALAAAMGIGTPIIAPSVRRHECEPSVSCDIDHLSVVDWGEMITTDYGSASVMDTPQRRDYSICTARALDIATQEIDARRLAGWGATAMWSDVTAKSVAREKIGQRMPGMGAKRAYKQGNEIASRAREEARQYFGALRLALRSLADEIDGRAKANGKALWSLHITEATYDAKLVSWPTPQGVELTPWITHEQGTCNIA